MEASRGTVHGIVTGKVQGVWYRRFVQHEASLYDVHGYAKNLDDGSVEVLLTGDIDHLHDMIKQLIIGTDASRVDKIEIVPHQYSELDGFKIL